MFTFPGQTTNIKKSNVK